MVYDSKECQNKTFENYIYVDHIYVCSVVSHCQDPAARYKQNLKLTNVVEESKRTVKGQKRQIEALQSQLGETNAPKRFTLTNIKVGTSLMKWKCAFSFK